MAAQKGRDLLMRMGNGGNPEQFDTIAGLRTRRLNMSSDLVETTHAESVGAWRELLGGGGVRKVDINGDGVFVDAASDARLRAVFFSQEVASMELVIPGFGTLSGSFIVSQLSYSGGHQDELRFATSLSSAGVINFVPV